MDWGKSKTVSVSALVTIWGALIVLLLLTAVSALFALGPLNVVVNLGVSFMKTFLVMAFFMHLNAEHGLIRIVAVAGLVWLCFLIGLSLSDYLTRVDLPAPW